MTDISKAFPLLRCDRTKLLGLVGLAGALAYACDSEIRVYRGEATWNDAGAAGTSPVDDYDGTPSEPTHTVHVLLGEAGSGTAGASSGGIGGSAGAASGGSATGGSATGGSEEPVSFVCGDGVIDFDTEECDDGPGQEMDLCTDSCQVSDTPVEVQDVDHAWELRSRTLGEGRHLIGASKHGFGVTYLEPDSDPPIVGLTVFSNAATPGPRIVVSEDATPALLANPVVAALSDGYAVAWTDLAADGDATGIAARIVDPDGNLGSLRTGNAEPDFSQYDPDILSVDDRVVVAWTDDRNAETAPDLYYRVLSEDLGGSDEDQVLSDSSALEGQVALAELGGSWGAAWRASTDDGRESIEVQDMGAQVHWSIGPIDPGPVEDHPALMRLSKSLRLVIFSGHDPADTDFSEPTRLWFAVLSTSDPGSVEPQEVTFSGLYPASDRALSHPNLVRLGYMGALAWRSAALPGDPAGEDAWTMPFGWRLVSGGLDIVFGAERPLPRWAEGSQGDQRFPALAAAPITQGLALAAAWDDYGQQYGNLQGKPDVLVQMTPLDAARDGDRHVDCSPTNRCGPGEGFCENDAECEDDLICSDTNGPNFGMSEDYHVCVEEHCANGIKDADEGRVDCGGVDCGYCQCADGIVATTLGEECDETVQTAWCDLDCTLPECGDEIYNPQAGEQCDPSAGMSCDADCTYPPSCTATDGTCTLSIKRSNIGTYGDNKINPILQILNSTGSDVPLSELEVRYWFTSSGTTFNVYCDAPTTFCSSITRTTVAMPPGVPGATAYLRLRFTGTGTITNGGNSGSMYIRVMRTDSANFDERDDFSWTNVSSLTYAPNIALYRNGVLVWGTEPVPTPLPPVYICGNDVLDPGEICDPGPGPGVEKATCDRDCTGAECGDDVLNRTAGEVCEPGLMSGCNSSCTGYGGSGGTGGTGGTGGSGGTGGTGGSGGLCNDPNTCLHAVHAITDNWDDTAIRPQLKIVNSSALPVPISELTVRYYFDYEHAGTQFEHWCDWAALTGWDNQCSEVNRSLGTLPSALPGAEYYLQLTFSTSVILPPGGSTNELKFRLSETSTWGIFHENNDWSNTKMSVYTNAPKVVIVRGGSVVWGEEPHYP